MKTFVTGSRLLADTKLHRYVSLESFLWFVETRCLSLTKVDHWDDTWEAFSAKIPTMHENGKVEWPLYSFHQDLYGVCWSRLSESDAMWRIYSPQRTGIQLSTSASKFSLIGGLTRWLLDDVIYFETEHELFTTKSTRNGPFDDALFKRVAFSHEREVRLLTHGRFIHGFKHGLSHVNVPLDPVSFIEGVTLDPRADAWYVATIARYCERAGLAVTPSKSTLYEPEPYRKSNYVKKYISVNRSASDDGSSGR